MHRLILPFLVLPLAAFAAEAEPALRWFKGNTHSHTLNSDGDSPVGVVTHWYRDHGYDFLVVSDHRYITGVAERQREFDRAVVRQAKRPFLLIPGQEVDGDIPGPDGVRRYTVHFTAMVPQDLVPKIDGESVPKVSQAIVDAIRGVGGLTILNHPNFHWSVSAADFLAMRKIRHFELQSGHPAVHNYGGSGRPGVEETWDLVLSTGRIYYGVGSDDAHHYQDWSRARSNPGRAWIMVRARELSVPAIVNAIDQGEFYASTGVELDEVTAAEGTLSLKIRQQAVVPDPRLATNLYGYRTTFIGKDGRVLKVDDSMTPSYTLQPGDLYVRARVVSSLGDVAWTQPLFAPGQGRFE